MEVILRNVRRKRGLNQLASDETGLDDGLTNDFKILIIKKRTNNCGCTSCGLSWFNRIMCTCNCVVRIPFF